MLGETTGSTGQPEKILVSIRVRPLNDKEIAKKDVSDWECINNNTILCRNNITERSLLPSAYTFDRVFDCDIPTKQVYEEGAKEVALSVVSGVNSSIFAYGQTSSGKTYTMTGITQEAMNDIFDYMESHQEREYIMKFSAMEIYNEAVRDLLSSDTTPLRLLDDPERGTVVEKLTEEALEDRCHLEELLSMCETQRKIGETSLNETSSRSHQILRLTIESCVKDYMRSQGSSILTASVCFVDLAGSERASQANSVGTRLKEGSHINRSLLTLGTVIRKLSKGKNGHVPFRDSKLTRILQNSLGGNARTAIICTMSPARTHVEQSRNTLLFASCAKEVNTNAQVNLVVSDKALVKQLQKELARMENELRTIGSSSLDPDYPSLLRDKENLIKKMADQIKELTLQRDLAQSQVKNLLRSERNDEALSHERFSIVSSSDSCKQDMDRRGIENGSKDSDIPILSDPGKYLPGLRRNYDVNYSNPQFNGLDTGRAWLNIVQAEDKERQDVWREVKCSEMEDPIDNGKLEMDLILDRATVVGVHSVASDEKKGRNKIISKAIFLDDEVKEKFSLATCNEDYLQGQMEKQRNPCPEDKDENEDNDIKKYLDTGKKPMIPLEKDGEPNTYSEERTIGLVQSIQAKDRIESQENNGQEKRSDSDEAHEAMKEKVRKFSREKSDQPTSYSQERIIDLVPSVQAKDNKDYRGKGGLEKHKDIDEANQVSKENLRNFPPKKDDQLNSCLEERNSGFIPSIEAEDKKDYQEKRGSEKHDDTNENQGEFKEVRKFPPKSDHQNNFNLEERTIGLVPSVETEDKEGSQEKESLVHANMDEAHEALKEKVRKLQNTIDYLLALQTLEKSPMEIDCLSPISMKFEKSRSCRENLLLRKSPLWLENPGGKGNFLFRSDFASGLNGSHSRRYSEQMDSTTSALKSFPSHGSFTSFDTESTVSSTSIETQSIRDAEITSSYHEHLARLNQIVVNAQNSKGSHLQNRLSEEPGLLEKRNNQEENVMYSEGSDIGDIQASPSSVSRVIKIDNAGSRDNLGDQSIQDTETKDEQPREHTHGSVAVTLHASSSSWASQFERQQREIIELWSACKVPLVHRTYFFSLFKGDRSDFVYMEVELRRLSFLRDSQSREAGTTRRQSSRMLSREREWLGKQISKKYSRKEREKLYQKWSIKLNTKRRSLQLSNMLWNDTNDMQHIKESADLVAQLVGLAEQRQVPKEMFGLSLSPRSVDMRSFNLKHSKSSLR